MKKRMVKKMVRSGQCPKCKSHCGMSQFDAKTLKRVANICHDCHTVAVIDRGRVVSEIDDGMKEAFREAVFMEGKEQLREINK